MGDFEYLKIFITEVTYLILYTSVWNCQMQFRCHHYMWIIMILPTNFCSPLCVCMSQQSWECISYLTALFFVAESEVGGQRLQKSHIHTSGWSLICMISFGGVNFVKSVISIILVALLGHKNDPITESSDLGVQHAKSCVSWIQTTYQKMGGCMLLLAELSTTLGMSMMIQSPN